MSPNRVILGIARGETVQVMGFVISMTSCTGNYIVSRNVKSTKIISCYNKVTTILVSVVRSRRRLFTT